jgi:hypothetical protein
MTDRELLQQALDALESWQKTCLDCGRSSEELGRATKPLQEIRTRLSQPDPDAVAWVNPATLQDLKDGKEGVHLVYEVEMVNSIPLFEYQPEKEWVGLTDEDRWELVQKTPSFDEAVAAVEAKLKEKNSD